MFKYQTRLPISILKQPADIFGLKYEYSIRPYDDDNDFIGLASDPPIQFGHEISPANYAKCVELAHNHATHAIVEIGVARGNALKSTAAFLENKPDHVPYLGIDVENKSFLDNKERNIYTICCNSNEQEKVRGYLKELGINEISLLFIDGWHSVNMVLNDWKYADLLVVGGCVGFHDTNYHPGPSTLLDAIDEKLFRVEKFFSKDADWGMATAVRID